MLGRQAVELRVGLTADGAHGGAQRVAAFGLGGDLGFDRVEIDKPRLEDGLRHGFEGLVDAAVDCNLAIDPDQLLCNSILIMTGRECDLKST